MNYIINENEQNFLKYSIRQIVNELINKIVCETNETNETNERIGNVSEIEVNNIFFKKIYKFTEIYYRNIDKSFIHVTINIEFYENELNLNLYEKCNNDDDDDNDIKEDEMNIDARSSCSVRTSDSYSISSISSISSKKREKEKREKREIEREKKEREKKEKREI